jgi:hypothetical protein
LYKDYINWCALSVVAGAMADKDKVSKTVIHDVGRILRVMK